MEVARILWSLQTGVKPLANIFKIKDFSPTFVSSVSSPNVGLAQKVPHLYQPTRLGTTLLGISSEESSPVSPLLITLLIVIGIILLGSIAYINHVVENSKLEKARQRADLQDRIRRCADVSESMPGQLMTPAMKLLLSNMELKLSERLLPLEKNNSDLRTRIEELRNLVSKADGIPVRNAPRAVSNEAQAKEIRFLLENFHSLLTRATQEQQLSAAESKQWAGEIRQALVHTHIELFSNLGQHYLQKNEPRQARLAIERGVQYLKKQPEPAKYQKALQLFEQQLERINALVLQASAPDANLSNALTEGLQALDEEDDWKKKSF